MRLGPHVNTTHRANRAADYIREVRPDACKMLDSGWSPDVVAAARASGTLIIGRYYWDAQRLGAEHGRFIERSVGFAVAQGVDLMEGCNEAFQNGAELARYAEAEIERMKALERHGKRAAIGCFSCGNPSNMSDWRYFRPALEYAAAHNHVLALHEYSGPVMQWMAGRNQVTPQGYALTDDCERPGVDGWLCLRYRKVLAICREWGIGNLNVVITESGIDDVQPRPGPQGKGYKSYYGTPYANMAPFGDYASQLAWYGRRLTEDVNVIGWTDFGFSQAGDWQTFDLSEDDAMLARVRSEMLRLPRGSTGAPSPPPTPPPTPTPTPPAPEPVPPVASGRPTVMIGVLRGDGWWPIARRIWPTVRAGYVTELQRANTWAMPLKPGYVLTVPAVGGVRVVKRKPERAYHPALGMPWPAHAVQPGETWAWIARRYQVTEAALRAANSGERDEPDRTPGDGVALVIPGWTVEVG